MTRTILLIAAIFAISSTSTLAQDTKSGRVDLMAAVTDLSGFGLDKDKEQTLKSTNKEVLQGLFEIADSDKSDDEKLALFKKAKEDNTKKYVDILGLEGFADYQTQTGNDAHSAFIDPRFVDLVTPDLHLRETSPAIDAGQTLAEAGSWDIDAEARRQGNAMDLGADEVSGFD